MSYVAYIHTFCKNDLKSQADDMADDNCCVGSLRVKLKLTVSFRSMQAAKTV